MAVQGERVIPVFIEKEMKSSYIDYSMSIIVSRALPDIRDGLKPSQRRILVAMNDLNLAPGRTYRKCAKIAGDTSGNYHPHGEQVVYPTLVRMAQDFNFRYPLIDGQGNFGSIDGDPPAAMRYTEARLTPLAMEMLVDLDKDAVDFVPNYDETRQEATILPGRFPNLLCNGSSGIAVGMATSVPPHNLGEMVDGLVALIDDPGMEVEALMDYIQGPDFPTGASVYGREGILEAYRTGKGKILIRAKAKLETLKGGKEGIVIGEIPYLVNKTNLIEKIVELVREKKIEGIADLRDESDREGMRIIIELKKGTQAGVVLNQLYKQTQLQATFGVIMLALVDGQPRILNLRQLLQGFIDHRHGVILRRTKFELDKAERRAHILEGLKAALGHIDEIIAVIEKSPNPDTAKGSLMQRFGLSEVQARAILDMRLQRLTGLERGRVEEEYLQLIKQIAELKGILESRTRRLEILKRELLDLKGKYGDPRRTEIVEETRGFTVEDLIAEDDIVVTITHAGYIKRLPMGVYRRQKRGGKGVAGIAVKGEDFVEHLFTASTHSYILLFTDKSRCCWLKVHQIPQGGRLTKGKAIVNLLELAEGEKVATFLPVREFCDGHYVIMATRRGLVKRTSLSAYANPRRRGINAVSLVEGDNLIDVKLTNGSQELILGTRNGQAIRFHEDEISEMGRVARGVRGIALQEGDQVVSMVVVQRGATLLVVTENGFGKRTSMESYKTTRRGGKGVIAIRISERNGKAVAFKGVMEEDELVLTSAKGIAIRLPVKGIRIIGRNTRGVRLIDLEDGDRVVAVAVVANGEG